MKTSLLTLFCVMFLLSGCMSAWRQPVPDLEMVYDIPYIDPNQLGFINSDGSDSTILTLGRSMRSYFFRPIWSMDGNYLYGLTYATASQYWGYPAYWNVKTGEFKVCITKQGIFAQIEGTGNRANLTEVLVSDAYTIFQINLDKCEFNKIVEYDFHVNLRGFSYFPATQDLLYGLNLDPQYTPFLVIKKLNLKTGETVELGEGFNPVWSPDGSRIVYIGRDGIYTMGAGGENPTLLQPADWYNDSHGATIPRWSPDGKWITFFDCKKTKCYRDLTIFRIPSDGGAPQEIVTGGMNASWKP